MKFVCFISLASVQIYIQVVPLCNNNIRKRVYMAFEQGLFNSTSKKRYVHTSKRSPFNLTRTLTKFSFLDIPAYTQMFYLNCVATKFLDANSSLYNSKN